MSSKDPRVRYKHLKRVGCYLYFRVEEKTVFVLRLRHVKRRTQPKF